MNFKSGKLEAYFFPPVNVPPYNRDFGYVKTRLGLKPGINKEHVAQSLSKFGQSDEMYSLLNEYQINPGEGWYIKPGMSL
jgi:hypothetical protein